jgi:hypothetical protein
MIRVNEALALKSQPIAPHEVHEAKVLNFPDKVIDVFNALISEAYCEGTARFTERAVKEELVKRGLPWSETHDIDFWLVGEIYEPAGWQVILEDVGGEDVYKPQYTFTRVALSGQEDIYWYDTKDEE